jgi:hypothetical protein
MKRSRIYSPEGEEMQSPPPGWMPGNIPNPPPLPSSSGPLKRKFVLISLVTFIAIGLLVGILFFKSVLGNNGATHPHLGDPYSDFLATYGSQQIDSGNGPVSAKFYADSSNTIILTVQWSIEDTTPNSKVVAVGVSGPNTWTSNQTIAYCKGFLPVDATPDAPLSSNVDVYKSIIGGISFMLVAPGQCQVWISWGVNPGMKWNWLNPGESISARREWRFISAEKKKRHLRVSSSFT